MYNSLKKVNFEKIIGRQVQNLPQFTKKNLEVNLW